MYLQCGQFLSHINCFIHGEVIGFQVLLDSLHHIVRQCADGLLQFSEGKMLRSSWQLFHVFYVYILVAKCEHLTKTRLTAALVTSTLPNPVLVSAKLCQHHIQHVFNIHRHSINIILTIPHTAETRHLKPKHQSI